MSKSPLRPNFVLTPTPPKLYVTTPARPGVRFHQACLPPRPAQRQEVLVGGDGVVGASRGEIGVAEGFPRVKLRRVQSDRVLRERDGVGASARSLERPNQLAVDHRIQGIEPLRQLHLREAGRRRVPEEVGVVEVGRRVGRVERDGAPELPLRGCPVPVVRQ